MQNTLYHHGILGQRWGVRRFQNKDGSLTPAGKKRYADPVSDSDKQQIVKQAGLDQAYRKAMVNNSKTKFAKDITDQSGNLIRELKKSSDQQIKNGVKKEKLDLSKMSDKELRDRINRELLERQYTSMFAKDVSTVTKGQKAVNDTLTMAGSALAVTSSALGIALAIKQLKG